MTSCPDFACYGRAAGDPHYLTYDGFRYDLQQHCSHIFTKDCYNNSFTVYSVTSDACSRGRGPTCIEEAYIETGVFRLRLYRVGSSVRYLFIGQVADSDVVVIVKKLRMITVYLPQLGVTVHFRRYYLSVCANGRYAGKLCGLLGDCNAVSSDDFKLQDGSITTNLLAFEADYRAPNITDVCTLGEIPQMGSCTDPARKVAAEAFCAALLLTSGGPYSACHASVDPATAHTNCVLDVCLCQGDDASCGCPVVRDYAQSCKENGVDVRLHAACGESVRWYTKAMGLGFRIWMS